MHEVLVNRLGGLSTPRKSVVRLTDRPDMTVDVYRGRKTTMQQSTLIISTSNISNNRLSGRENLVLVLTQKSKIGLHNIVEKRRTCSWGAEIAPGEQFLPISTIFSIYISN